MAHSISKHLRRNVVSYVALFVALGGTSYAAVALPKNSVGTPQLKPSSVTSAKVKNGSLLRKDFKTGELSVAGAGAAAGAGAQGPAGVAGTPGAKGEAGKDGLLGDTGPRGPSDGYSSANNAVPTGISGAVEDSLSVPAGAYVVTATADIENGGAGAAGAVTCLLKGGIFPFDTTVIDLPADGAADDRGAMALSGAVQFGSDATLSVDCSNGAGVAGQIDHLDIQAVRVATVTADPIF